MNAALIDRALQRRLREYLAETFPKPSFVNLDADRTAIEVNLAYLAQHGLIVHRVHRSPRGGAPWDMGWAITSDGVDFIRDDGGLSAILGVVTVRLHDDTIKGLVEARIMASPLPQPDKRRYLSRLRELPADATRHLVLKLIEKALDRAPDALQLLETILQ